MCIGGRVPASLWPLLSYSGPRSTHRVHLFDVIGVIYFGGMLILLGALQPHNLDTWGRYAQAVAHGSLTVIIFGSILVNRPFTEPYAREQVPKAFWQRSPVPCDQPEDLLGLGPGLLGWYRFLGRGGLDG